MDWSYREVVTIDSDGSSPEPDISEHTGEIGGKITASNLKPVGQHSPSILDESSNLTIHGIKNAPTVGLQSTASSPPQQFQLRRPVPLGSGSLPIPHILRNVPENLRKGLEYRLNGLGSIQDADLHDSPLPGGIGSHLGLDLPNPADEKKFHEGSKVGDGNERLSMHLSTGSSTSFPQPCIQNQPKTNGSPIPIQDQNSIRSGLPQPVLGTATRQLSINGLPILSQQQQATQPSIPRVQLQGSIGQNGLSMHGEVRSGFQPANFLGVPPPAGPKSMKIEICDYELPFKVFHLLVCTVQKTLEEALFDFAKKCIPKLLQREGWQAPEQGELNIWTRVLELYKGDINFAFRASNFSESFQDMKRMLGRLHHLRHAAVHRLPVGISWLRRWMIDAVDLSQCLAVCLQEPHRYIKLNVIELGLWQPHKVNLEEIATKSLGHFKGFDFPNRNDFLVGAVLAEVRSSSARGPETKAGFRARNGRGSVAEPAQSIIGNGQPASPPRAGLVPPAFMPSRMSSKRPRSPSPPEATAATRSSKRLKAMHARTNAAKIMIDLTEEEQVQQNSSSIESTLTTASKVVIDLTED